MSKIWAPHDYQTTAADFLKARTGAALFLDPGLGKTAITLKVISELIASGKVRKVLLVAPLQVVVGVWPAEIAKWEQFTHLKIAVVHGTSKKTGKEAALKSDANIYAINFEGMRWLLTKLNTAAKIKAFGFDMLVVDELSKYKGSQTKGFKMLRPLLPAFKYRYGLTGSPAANSLMSLFGEMYILDDGAALGKYVTHYRAKYFDAVGYGGYTYILKKGMEEKIYEQIGDKALRMSAKEYLTMPELIHTKMNVVLNAEDQRLYNTLEEHFIAEVDDGTLTASTAAVCSSKLRQIASGTVYLQDEFDEVIVQQVHKGKIEALQNLVEELHGQPLLVGFDFRASADSFREVFPDAPIIYGGSHSAEQLRLLINRWNDGAIPVMFGHPASMGHGLNLQASCHNVCWYTMPWSFEYYDQFNRRVYRQGAQAKPCFIHHLITQHTLDVDVYESLQAHGSTQERLFQALQDYVAKKKGGR